MLTPLSWLKDFTPVDRDPGEIASVLTSLGLVVEGVQRVGEPFDGVVVGHVVEVRAHPDADKVRLVDVDLGDGSTTQIACGASNVARGQRVAVATVGTTLPSGMTIDRRKLRGEWSNGMICSTDELGLGKARAPGIMVLPVDAPVGAPLFDALGIKPDIVYDLAIETNRPDAMCITGVARDLAGKLKLPFSIPEPTVREGEAKVGDLTSITVKRPDLCPRFTARVLVDVTVGASPELIARRLTLAGMRPINNVVDASNYVMLELGQPSHPYDLDRLAGSGLRVRAARDGERLRTLDDIERELTERDCVITDAEDHVVGIAGIMGGESSEIAASTTTVLNEAAVWDPYVLNYTSRRLALRTDASARFERRVDSDALLRAQNRFIEIVQQSTSAVAAVGVIDEHAPQPPSVKVRVRTGRVNAVLGVTLSDEQVRDYLEPIGFDAVAVEPGINEVIIPSFRPDSEREIDVIEEIARMHGYENIEPTMPMSPLVGGLSAYQQRRRRLRAWLAGQGMSEAWTSPLLAGDDFDRSGLDAALSIGLVNPIVSEESKLRTSLLPGMLRAVAFNATRRNVGVRLFEIAHVFNQPRPGELLPDEEERLAVALACEGNDAMSAARLWRDLLASLRVRGLTLRNGVSAPGLHPTRCGEVRTESGRSIGVIGEVDPSVLERWDIPGRVGWLEVETGALLEAIDPTPQMRAVSRYPAAEFDLAFLVPVEISASDVEATLRGALGAVVEQVQLFDVFRGEQAGEGRRSLAYRLTVAALDHTLDETEVSDLRRKAIDAVESSHGASLRM